MDHTIPEDRFDTLFRVLSSSRFLAKEGLGNEVPYFIETYEIRNQYNVYKKLNALIKRLETTGIQVLSFGLYDFVIDHFESEGELKKLFEAEKSVPKHKFQTEMTKMVSLRTITVPEIARRTKESGAQLIIIWQVGEVYPFIRTHELLSSLQSELTDKPVVVFFPGTYTSSYDDGFQLSLFGTQTARYYRAFKLDEFLAREDF